MTSGARLEQAAGGEARSALVAPEGARLRGACCALGSLWSLLWRAGFAFAHPLSLDPAVWVRLCRPPSFPVLLPRTLDLQRSRLPRTEGSFWSVRGALWLGWAGGGSSRVNKCSENWKRVGSHPHGFLLSPCCLRQS
jgi:hypothetical protein